MAELVREAVDEYLGDELDPTDALTGTFGAAPDAFVPSRDDWGIVADVLLDTDVLHQPSSRRS